MRSAFINQPYDGVKRMGGDSWLFYYGVKPGKVDRLHIGSKFHIVYTFSWSVVQFCVEAGHSGSHHIYTESTRPLDPDEIDYFKGLVAGLGQ